MLTDKGTASKEVFYKTEEVEGLPIDFSFKGLRALEGILVLTKSFWRLTLN
jgi:hypothetical protein